ncbi:MAG: transporter substrate-binding domain-containing protein [Clostridia bacterium]|nr:transporter substrate-binding domain-containing protein [Clostridia bacterium]
MKKMIAMILAAMMVLSMTCAFAEGGKLAEIQSKGKLTICTDAAWAPFEYIGANGEETGSDIELAKYIAQQLGVEPEIKNVAFDSISTYLVNNEADISISAMTITEERKETLDFSVPYATAQQYIIVLADNDKVTVLDDLAGAAIGVHLGTTGDFLVSDECMMGVLANTGASVSQYKFLTDAALALKNGELGAIVCDTMLAENIVAVNEGLKCFPLSYKAGAAEIEQLGIAMKKGDEEFLAKINEIITPIIEDGTVDKWIVEHSELASALN